MAEEQSGDTLTINREALIRFFDEKDDDSTGHATGIVGVIGEDLNTACFVHYVQSQGGTTEVLSGPVTTGKNKGPRLDRWIKVQWADGSVRAYQTEIKNWSSHAIGGKNLSYSANGNVLQSYRAERLAFHWDLDGGCFRPRNRKLLEKVLTPMTLPAGVQRKDVRPLVIFWEAMGVDGVDSPMFSVEPKGAKFPELWMFSVSAYLRSLSEDTISLPMPNAARRIVHLRSIVPMLPT